MNQVKPVSRTKNAIKNLISGVCGQVLIMILKFITRTVFIQTLGKSCLGINGLFTNILDILSLAELGIGTAIIYNLYRPIALNNYHRILILMKFYKQSYRMIGLTITILGVCMIPLLPKLINDYDTLAKLNINVTLIFIIYLMQSVSTYLFFAYKSALVKAHQKEYKLTIIGYGFTIAVNLLQIITLYIFSSFMIYTCLVIAFNILQNLVYAKISDRMYPYSKEKTDDKLSLAEIKEIFKDCSALFLYKINSVVVNATGNIILSIYSGLVVVGLYSNYLMLYNMFKMIFIMFFNAINASLGNLHATSTIEHQYEVFKVVNLITAFLYGTVSIGIFVVANEFIEIWIGADFVLPQPVALLLAIEFFTYGLQSALSKFRNTMGLFQQAKYWPLVGIIINIIVSIALVRSIGICGLLIGTLVSTWTTFMWFDPIIIYKHGFKNSQPVKKYYLNILLNILLLFALGLISWYLCSIVNINGWLIIVVHTMICAVVSIIGFAIVYLKSSEVKYLKKVAKHLKKEFLGGKSEFEL